MTLDWLKKGRSRPVPGQNSNRLWNQPHSLFPTPRPGPSRLLKFQIGGHDPTVWWRGSRGFLGFGIALLIWQILRHVSP